MSKQRELFPESLSPKILKNHIIKASLFSMAFEMLKSTLIEKIRYFFSDIEENELVLSSEYQENVLALNKSPLYASLEWYARMGAINDSDILIFEEIKKARNELTHEMFSLLFLKTAINVDDLMEKILELLRKIEFWWFQNMEPEGLLIDKNDFVPGSVLSVQMLSELTLGTDQQAELYYKKISELYNKDKSKI